VAATSKDELLTVTFKEYGRLQALIADLSDAQATWKDGEDTSIKDVIGHRAHWIDLFLGWYEDGLAGKEVFFPAPGYKWNQLKAYNTALRESQAGTNWPDIGQLLSDNHARLRAFITNHSNADLYGGPMKGANNDWSLG